MPLVEKKLTAFNGQTNYIRDAANKTKPRVVLLGFFNHLKLQKIMGSADQTCRNCGGDEFYSRDISLMGGTAELLPVGFTFSRDVHLRVCGRCGLMDLFVKPDTLEKVKQKFQQDS